MKKSPFWRLRGLVIGCCAAPGCVIAAERPAARMAPGIMTAAAARPAAARLMRMRLLLWYWGRRGGGAQQILALATGLGAARTTSRSRCRCRRSANCSPQIRATGLPVDAVPTYRSARRLRGGRRCACPASAGGCGTRREAFGADVVVSVMTHLWTPLVAPGLKRAGLRFVPMVHDAEPHPGDCGALWEWRLARELKAAESAIAFSDSVAAGIQAAAAGVAGASPAARRDPAPASGRSRHAHRRPAPRFVNLGRLRAYKGLDLLRDAWRLAQPRVPGATLLVAGEGDAEALAPGLSALPGVEVRSGWLAEGEMARLVAGADVVVLPYREASQSGVAPLAHGFGVPVVATPVGGLREQLRDGVDGVLAGAVTAEALADAMVRASDPVHRATLAEGARESGLRVNDWDAMADELLQALGAADRLIRTGRALEACFREHVLDRAVGGDPPALQPDRPGAPFAHHAHVMRRDDQDVGAGHQARQAFLGALHEVGIAGEEPFVHQQDVGRHRGGHGEGQPHIHAGRIAAHRHVEEIAEPREARDLIGQGAALRPRSCRGTGRAARRFRARSAANPCRRRDRSASRSRPSTRSRPATGS